MIYKGQRIVNSGSYVLSNGNGYYHLGELRPRVVSSDNGWDTKREYKHPTYASLTRMQRLWDTIDKSSPTDQSGGVT